MDIEKYYNEKGEVAVLYSPGFGAGWSTWNDDIGEQLVFNKTIVEMVLIGRRSDITEGLCKSLFNKDFYIGGARDLEVKFVKKGAKFRITEYDGAESVEILDEIVFFVA